MTPRKAAALEKLANISSTQSQITQQSILVADTSQESEIIGHDLEHFLQRHIALIDSMSDQHGLDTSTIFLALFTCRGDVEDARRFLLGDFSGLKHPPLPQDGLLHIFQHGSFPPPHQA